MITQEDCDKIVNTLRNVCGALINDSIKMMLISGVFTACFFKEFKKMLPDGVSLPADAEKMMGDFSEFQASIRDLKI